jgi:hypothetical protein
MLCARAFLAASFAVVAASGQTPPTEAKQLLAYISRKGADTTLKELTAGNESRWNKVLSNIDLGSAAWLDVAQGLLPASDAGGTEDLYISLAVALTHNPEGVLSMVGPTKITLEQVCSIPFIEADDKTEREHVLKVRAALGRVVSPALALKKTECLKIINAEAARIAPKP